MRDLDPSRNLIFDICLTACLVDCVNLYFQTIRCWPDATGKHFGRSEGVRVRISRARLILMLLREALKTQTRRTNTFTHKHMNIPAYTAFNYINKKCLRNTSLLKQSLSHQRTTHNPSPLGFVRSFKRNDMF